MNDVFAMRAHTAALSDVGGESSPQTDRKNTKVCDPWINSEFRHRRHDDHCEVYVAHYIQDRRICFH
jgi:hypothetical protein